jgi:hypothetical protein
MPWYEMLGRYAEDPSWLVFAETPELAAHQAIKEELPVRPGYGPDGGLIPVEVKIAPPVTHRCPSGCGETSTAPGWCYGPPGRPHAAIPMEPIDNGEDDAVAVARVRL